MNNIIRPLRLAVGSHRAGSGKGCAMNVVSWMNGDTTITDMPDCVDPVLARVVQTVNDTMCRHRDGDLLCAECSVKVLGLAFRTIGTAGLATPADYARLARWAACVTNATYATVAAANAAADADARWVSFGHALIDEFDRITGRTTTPNPGAVNHAITRMLQVHP